MKHLICGEVVESYCGKFTAYGDGMDWVIQCADGSLLRGRIPSSASEYVQVGDRVAFYAQLYQDPIPVLGQRFECKYLWKRPTRAVLIPDVRAPLMLAQPEAIA